MKSDNTITPEQLPYGKLARFGIDREKADKLPQDVKERLAKGEVTPLLQVSITARNGDTITLPLKLLMTADRNGQPALIAYPVRAEMERERNALVVERLMSTCFCCFAWKRFYGTLGFAALAFAAASPLAALMACT